MGAPDGQRADDLKFMKRALALAAQARGCTSPNPMVGALLVRNGRIIGEGWHRQAGRPHAEIEALNAARQHGHDPAGTTLYVTLEPCSTHGRTPPCTDAILNSEISRVVIGATDPNPRHAGRALALLRRAGVRVDAGFLEAECSRLNESFNHWIVHRVPFVTLKSAQSLDGKIATTAGLSKWLTSPASRSIGMQLRHSADAIMVGINTVLADDPSLTFRPSSKKEIKLAPLRRFVLDTQGRTPLTAKLLQENSDGLTTIVVGRGRAGTKNLTALHKLAPVMEAPVRGRQIDLHWVLKKLGDENVTHLLVEGGGQINFSFLKAGLVHRLVFFYAPLILGGGAARKSVAGPGFPEARLGARISEMEWRRVGPDLLVTGRLDRRKT